MGQIFQSEEDPGNAKIFIYVNAIASLLRTNHKVRRVLSSYPFLDDIGYFGLNRQNLMSEKGHLDIPI